MMHDGLMLCSAKRFGERKRKSAERPRAILQQTRTASCDLRQDSRTRHATRPETHHASCTISRQHCPNAETIPHSPEPIAHGPETITELKRHSSTSILRTSSHPAHTTHYPPSSDNRPISQPIPQPIPMQTDPRLPRPPHVILHIHPRATITCTPLLMHGSAH
eukprot:CAMPEP_0181201288 /NCGR_PEP_ID=MMETSP1096-20121128/18224_1 /TAXON_ID=156174 ORGANISM="Chrysochromulina ericina, Strain CCMP281" /NCGR_SAMPLE_ID=MMETSP1096 /ASSEMBLY_ACC=CAM_ASM_000453 /LENGTH=162 /DNA_ID=CAMNT_0023291715 /DNA_START=363 /DNA_END=851 /DNA_ORIENTATION=+